MIHEVQEHHSLFFPPLKEFKNNFFFIKDNENYFSGTKQTQSFWGSKQAGRKDLQNRPHS